MKKGLLISALVLTIATSIIAGTLAMYTTSIDDLAAGSVVAKEFVLLENGSDTFKTDVKIAPTESQTWQFSVKNYDGSIVTETAMKLDFDVDVTASDGKAPIEPLVVTITNEAGEIVGTQQIGVGKIKFKDSFALKADGQQLTYTLTVEWPSNDAIDINYAGAGFGTAVKVSVTGTQI